MELNIEKMYLSSINKPILSTDEEKELAYRIRQGDNSAKNEFIERNLRLVVSVALKYKYISNGLEFMDLVQEGNIGLLQAVKKYDVTKGYKFSTYAVLLIKQSIIKAITNKSRNIRLTDYYYNKASEYRCAKTKLQMQLNREPLIEEIANELGISQEEASWLNSTRYRTTSLNKLVCNDEKEKFNELEVNESEVNELEDFVVDPNALVEDVAIDSMMQSEIKTLLKKCCLSDREIEILKLRYGFYDGNQETFSAISRKFKVTGERVRQIENSAIFKIRKSNYIKDFAVYMDSPDEAIKSIDCFRETYCKQSVKKRKDISNKLNKILKKTKNRNKV